MSVQAEHLIEITGFDRLWPSGQVLSCHSDDACSDQCHVTRECGTVCCVRLAPGPSIVEICPELEDINEELKSTQTSSVDGQTVRCHTAGTFRGIMPLTQGVAEPVRKKRPLPRPRGHVPSSSVHGVDLGWF